MYKELEELVVKAKENDKQAKLELITRFKGLIIKSATSIYIQGETTEDLIQIGIESLLKAINRYDCLKCNFAAYASRAITNNFNYMIRKSCRRNYEISLDAVVWCNYECKCSLYDNKTIEDKLIYEELMSNLNMSLDKLEPREKKIIKKYYYEKATINQCSEDMGICYSSCIKLKKRILNKLRNLLE